MKFRKLDRWSPYWFLGGFFFYHLGAAIMSPLVALFLVAIGAILKELGDEWYHLGSNKEHWFFDRRGGSWDDIIIGVLGAIVGTLF